MYINDDYKFAYLHIPKTGGVAIARYLIIPYNYRNAKAGTRHHKFVEGSVPDDYFVFAFIRNPYSRAVSLYRQRYLLNGRFKRKHPAVSDFLECLVNKTIKIPGPMRQVDFLTPRVKTYKYENYEENIQKICKRVGLKVPDMPKIADNNYYGKYDYRDWLNDFDIQKINEIYKEDFSLGYKMHGTR